MPALTQDTIELIVGNCESRLADLAESLSRELGVPTQLEFGSSDGWPPAESEAEWAGPGLVLTIEVEGVGLTALIPAALPLPNWIHAPTDTEQSQLETLVMEWSLHLLPDDAEASAFHARATSDLGAALEELSPADWAASALLWARPAAADLLEPPVPIRVIWPVTQPKYKPSVAPSAPAAHKSSGSASPAEKTPASAGQPAQPPRPAFDGLSRLRYLPVSVSVRVAEKKIALSQVLAITPGTLVTFTKNCEEPLDLYVNNQLYGHGEAVKIGENFGLKINTIGTTNKRVQKIVNE